MNKIFKQFTYIILLSIVLGFCRYLFLEDYSLIRTETNQKQVDISIDIDLQTFLLDAEEPGIISIDFAKQIYDQQLGVFIDARDNNEFNEGHILGSINIPYESDEKKYNNTLLDSLYSVDVPLVIYCSGEDCSLSYDLSYYLYSLGFVSIFYFEEGYPVWKELGYPHIDSLAKVEKKNSFKNIKFDFIDYIIFFSIIIISVLQYLDRYKHFIIHISKFILGFIFIYFSYDKILDPNLFADVVKNYDIIPFGLENMGALILPFFEFIIGICLIFGIFFDTAIILSIVLLLFFIIMIGQAYLRGKSIDCGCLLTDLSDISSTEKRMHMLKRIVQDICFILYAVILKYRAKININND